MGKYWERANGVAGNVEAVDEQQAAAPPPVGTDGGGKYWRRATGQPEPSHEMVEAVTPKPAIDPNQAQAEAMGGGIFRDVGNLIRGKRDPAYADVYGFHGQMVQEKNQPVLDAWSKSNLFAADDARHGDILKNALGDRFIRMERDANGYDVIVFRGPEGDERKGYVNRPGLDMEDVSRFVTGSMPYLAAGGLIGQGVRAASFPARALAQAAGQGATSVSADVAASAAGSEQGVDGQRAIIATGLGVAGEGVNAIAPKLWQHFVTEPKYFDRSSGRLTQLGEQAARDAGVDPATLSNELSKTFAQTYAREGASAANTVKAWSDQEFAIPTSRGQRTKDAGMLLEEKGMRYGVYGDKAKGVMQEFDRKQSEAIANAATTGGDGRGVVNILSGRETPTGLDPLDLGENIRGGVSAAQRGAKAQENAAWKQVTDITPKPEAFDSLPSAIQAELGPMRVDDVLTPIAMTMGKELDDYIAGKAIGNAGPKVFGQTPVRTLDEIRQRLLGMMKGTQPGSADSKAASAIYSGFNTWLGDTAKKGLVNGDPAAAASMLTARDITRTMKGIFSAQDLRGQRTAGGRLMEQILDDSGAVSADSLVTKMFGNNPKASVKDGTLEALTRIRHGLRKFGDPKQANEVWNDIRVANWMRLVKDRQGKMNDPGVMLGNVRAAFQSQRSVMQALYTKDEIAAMQRFATALNKVVAKDPNPSGSGVAIAALTRQFLMKLVEAVPYGRTALEYSGLPNAYGRAVATKAVSQSRAPYASRVPVAGGLAAVGRSFSSDADQTNR